MRLKPLIHLSGGSDFITCGATSGPWAFAAVYIEYQVRVTLGEQACAGMFLAAAGLVLARLRALTAPADSIELAGTSHA